MLTFFQGSTDQIRLLCRYPLDGPGRTLDGDGTFVAMNTAIMANLQVQRAIAKRAAALDAFRTTDAQLFMDGVFKKGILDEFTLNGFGRTELVFRRGIQPFDVGLMKAAAQFAVTAHGKGVHALDRRGREHAFRGTAAALGAQIRIDLPNQPVRASTEKAYTGDAADDRQGGDVEKGTTGVVFICHGRFPSLFAWRWLEVVHSGPSVDNARKRNRLDNPLASS